MTGESEQAAGQVLAVAILTALDRAAEGGAKPDWTAFVTAYEVALGAAATGLHKRYHGLYAFEPTEIVQAFLAAKVFPPERAKVLLGPVARGEQPLKPRLLASLGTYCIDLHRGEARQPISGESAIALPTVPLARPTVEEVEALVSRQFGAIRVAFDKAQTRAPYRGVLLLAQRFEWAWVLSGVELSRVGGSGEVTLGVERVVALTAWSTAEGNQLLGTDGSGVSLRLAWERVRPLACQPGRTPTGDLIAAELDVPRERWDGWVSRGRHLLKTQLGERTFGELFPVWVSNRG
jgi:hypothetical protein